MAAWSNSARLAHGSIGINVTLNSQDIDGNTSTITISSAIYADSGWGPSNSSGVSCALSGPGLSASGSFNLSVASGGSQAVMSRTITVPHDADGTKKNVTYAASIGDTGTTTFGGGGSVTVTFDLPAIARASQPTVSPTSADAGTTVTILTHRKSNAFTHDLTYKLGTATGTIVTGLPTDYDWTIPLSILSGIPDNTSGTCVITCVTKSGSTVVGTRTVNLTVKAPASVVPTIGGITCTEAVPAVASAVGAFVQKNSKLALAITGAAGAYGSTITAYKINTDGQTINADSGTTGLIQSAGTLTITATVTDSRGRTGTASGTITVLPYSPPTIDTGTTGIVRCLSNGTIDVFNGTYLLTTLKASVASLKPAATEKNTLTYRVSTRNHATGGTYTVKSTATPAGVSFNSTLTQFGTYDVSSSWDVLIEVVDLFATTAYLIVVPTGAAIQHLHPGGVGILKRHENGALDVGGDIYSTGMLNAARSRLTSTTTPTVSSTGHAFQAGADTGTNMAIGPAKIMARNNGAVSTLNINPDGGDIVLGKAGSTLKPWGVTFEAAEGAVTGQSVAAANTTAVTVTFPSGRFTAAPTVTATLLGDARDVTTNVDAASTTSVVVRLGSVGAARSGIGFNWIAVRLR